MLSQTLIRRIDRLIAKSLHLPTARSKHFSLLVKRGKIISFGWNQSFKSHPTAKLYGHRFNSIHSELHCIKNFPYPTNELREYTLVNVRVNPNGTAKTLAKPCGKCIYFLSCFELRSVIYTNENGDFVCL